MTRRLLILDDEPLIGWCLADELEFFNWHARHVVCNEAEAFAALERGSIDAAVLDFHLRGETSERFARHLLRVGIPFVFVSGAMPDNFPTFGARIDVLPKPVDFAALSQALSHTAARRVRPNAPIQTAVH